MTVPVKLYFNFSIKGYDDMFKFYYSAQQALNVESRNKLCYLYFFNHPSHKQLHYTFPLCYIP